MAKTVDGLAIPVETTERSPVLTAPKGILGKLQQRCRWITGAVLLSMMPTVYAQEPQKPTTGASDKPVGSLVLVGGGREIPEAEEEFGEMSGGSEAKIVVIPTGSKSFNPEIEGMEKYFRMQKQPQWLKFLHTRDREEANTEEFVRPLTEATGVWVAGGGQDLLAEAFVDTRVEREIRNLWLRGGVVGATSAGVSILCRNAIMGGDPAETGKGFDFLRRGFVDQHFMDRFRRDRLQGVVNDYRDTVPVGLGIDANTAVIFRQGKLGRVIGKKNVHICRPSSDSNHNMEVLKPGDPIDLNALGITIGPEEDAQKEAVAR